MRSTILVCSMLALMMALSASGSALFDAIAKKNLPSYVKALDAADAAESVNAPDKKGRFAIIESVKSRNKEFVEMTLEYGGNTSVAEAASGKTALHFAFANNDVPIARLLLAWGANADAVDKSGAVARAAAKSHKDMLALLAVLDEEGPVAFEDAPGTWRRGHDKEHNLDYFHNDASGKSLWRQPPSCAWQSTQVNESTAYVNAITHQTLWHLPAALAWRRLTKDGETFWFNFRTNTTQSDAPAEMPKALLDAVPVDGHYWHNAATGETAWEAPKLSDWTKLADPEGRVFFFNGKSGESTWDTPSELAWKEVHSEEHERGYWFNEVTKESQWEKPHSLAWSRVASKDEL